MKLARHTDTGAEVLVFLAFEDPSLQHGGRHRSEQLEELMTQAGWVLEQLPNARPGSRWLTLLWGIMAYCELAIFRPICAESLRGAGVYCYRLSKTLHSHPRIKTLLIEGTGDTALLMVPAARKQGVRVIVVPQNLESLAPYDRVFTHRIPLLARFGQEIKLLRGVEAAFCISTEEEWLLRLCGLPAFSLPYRPSAGFAARLLDLRSKRRALPGFGFLMLGSAINHPTLSGFRRFYRMLTQEMSDLAIIIHLAGRGTEQLREEFADPRVIVHGTVSDAQLDDLMIKAKGLLLMQAPTSGFLTRVIEARYIGIPIIGNVDAVKGFRELDGVHVYYQADDLRQLLASPQDSPVVPAQPAAEVELFRHVLLGAGASGP